MAGVPYRLTPYYHKEKEAGAKSAERGWRSPMNYGDPVAEHNAVRTAAGVFDVHTQGELLFQGPAALEAVQHLYVNDMDVPIGRAVYTQMCNENGGIMDDTITYRLGPKEWMAVTNSVNRDRSAASIKKLLAELGVAATVTDVTSGTAYFELQGPRSRDILQKVTDTDLSTAKLPYMWGTYGKVAEVDCWIARSGFTGELGYELYFPVEYGEYIWDSVFEAGKEFGIRPTGNQALGSCAIEKCYVGYGRDINENITPYEAGIGWTVKLDKPYDFIGKAALAKMKAQGIPKLLMCYTVDDGETIGEAGAKVSIGGKEVGEVTKGGKGLTVKKSIGMAYVPPKTAIGTKIVIQNKGGAVPATIVPRPFYDPKGERLRV